MKKVFLSLGILAFLLTGCVQEKNEVQSYIEIEGSAEKEVEPDIFYLSFTLSESNKGNISAMEERMIKALTALGVDIKNDLTITSMSGDNWNWWRRTRTVQQYKSYTLKTQKLPLLNNVCDKFDSLGYVSYYLSKTEYSKMDELKKEVQQEAVKNARIKAENLLSGEKRKAGDLLYLQERNAVTNVPVMYRNYYAEDQMSAKEVAPQAISFNKTKVRYEIIARYNIK